MKKYSIFLYTAYLSVFVCTGMEYKKLWSTDIIGIKIWFHGYNPTPDKNYNRRLSKIVDNTLLSPGNKEYLETIDTQYGIMTHYSCEEKLRGREISSFCLLNSVMPIVASNNEIWHYQGTELGKKSIDHHNELSVTRQLQLLQTLHCDLSEKEKIIKIECVKDFFVVISSNGRVLRWNIKNNNIIADSLATFSPDDGVTINNVHATAIDHNNGLLFLGLSQSRVAMYKLYSDERRAKMVIVFDDTDKHINHISICSKSIVFGACETRCKNFFVLGDIDDLMEHDGVFNTKKLLDLDKIVLLNDEHKKGTTIQVLDFFLLPNNDFYLGAKKYISKTVQGKRTSGSNADKEELITGIFNITESCIKQQLDMIGCSAENFVIPVYDSKGSVVGFNNIEAACAEPGGYWFEKMTVYGLPNCTNQGLFQGIDRTVKRHWWKHQNLASFVWNIPYLKVIFAISIVAVGIKLYVK